MEDVNGFVEDELSTVVSRDGTKLIVIARRIENEQWQLSVQNEHGISSNWLEFFSTAQVAIEAGIMAIENEGIEQFIETEGFEYLLASSESDLGDDI